jgi:hypothetical protein
LNERPLNSLQISIYQIIKYFKLNFSNNSKNIGDYLLNEELKELINDYLFVSLLKITKFNMNSNLFYFYSTHFWYLIEEFISINHKNINNEKIIRIISNYFVLGILIQYYLIVNNKKYKSNSFHFKNLLDEKLMVFILISLHNLNLFDIFKRILQEDDLIRKYFNNNSIFLTPEKKISFLKYLNYLSQLPFNIDILK